MAKHLEGKKNGFTQVSNEVLYNSKLSPKERIVLSGMLGLKDDWDFCISGLVTKIGLSKNAIQTTLKSLEKKGYLKRVRMKGPDGRFTKSVYEIYDEPQVESDVEAPDVDLPHVENPHVEIQPHNNIDLRKTESKYTPVRNNNNKYAVVKSDRRLDVEGLRQKVKHPYDNNSEAFKSISKSEEAFEFLKDSMSCYVSEYADSLNELPKETCEMLYECVFDILEGVPSYDSLTNPKGYIRSLIKKELTSRIS